MLGVTTELQEKVTGSMRQVWLAGLGAAIMAQEEGSRLFEVLLKKGEEAEQQGGSPVVRVKEGFKEASDKAATTWGSFTKRFDDEVAASLHRMGLPTREEIATLTRRVDALIASVDKLRVRTPGGRGEAPADEATSVKG